MGFNGTLLIMGDAIDEIGNDKEFGRKVADAFLRVHRRPAEDISSGCCVNAATMMTVHHADTTSIIAVGQNTFTLLDTLCFGHGDEEFKLRYYDHLRSELNKRGKIVVQEVEKNLLELAGILGYEMKKKT